MAPWKLLKLLLSTRYTSDFGSNRWLHLFTFKLQFCTLMSVYISSKNCTNFAHRSFKTLYVWSFYSLHLTIIYFKRRHWELNKFSINSFFVIFGFPCDVIDICFILFFSWFLWASHSWALQGRSVSSHPSKLQNSCTKFTDEHLPA